MIYGIYFAPPEVMSLFDAYLAPVTKDSSGKLVFELFVLLLTFVNAQVSYDFIDCFPLTSGSFRWGGGAWGSGAPPMIFRILLFLYKSVLIKLLYVYYLHNIFINLFISITFMRISLNTHFLII